MSKEVIQQVKPGVPYAFLLAILFIVLKVSGTVAWSWWLVLLPLWLGPALFLAFLAIVGLLAAIGFGIYGIVQLVSK